MPYVNCGHCTGATPTRLLELPNLPMPYCSACYRIVCHLCREPLKTSGCRHSQYASASVVLSSSSLSARQQTETASTLKTVTVNVGGVATTHSYNCPPGSYPPSPGDVLEIWTATEGKTFKPPLKSGTNGSGGGKVLSSGSGVFSLKEGAAGLPTYGAYDHFHVSRPGYALGSTERVWYYVDSTTIPVTIKFSQILNG